MRYPLLMASVLWPGVFASTAFAQIAEDNTVQEAENAFGISVGIEQIGLYDGRNVRGFSPIDAGNIRLEGFYVDRQIDYSNRLIRGSSIGAGLSAHSYLLPAPTGIADFSFRSVAQAPTQSVFLGLDPYGGWRATGDFQMRGASHTWEAAFGAGYRRQVVNNGSRDLFKTLGGNVRFTPGPSTRITLYGDYQRVNDQRSPQFLTASPIVPPKVFDRLDYLGQDWAQQKQHRLNTGILASFEGGFADFHLGLGHSRLTADAQTGQFIAGVTSDGDAQLFAFSGPGSKAVSNFLEARAQKTWSSESVRHDVSLVTRLRARKRVFGGTDVQTISAININRARDFDEPDFTPGDPTDEKVEQINIGGAYNLTFANIGRFVIGAQKTQYRRRLEQPGGQSITAKENPFLFNASAAIDITKTLTAFASIARGFEEGPIAPDVAANRNEAPEAILTDQIDAGLRFNISNMRIVTSVFQLEKPFFGLDQNQVFNTLGTIENRGIELSATGPLLTELQVTFGAVFSDPKLSGDAVDGGFLSADPIAFRKRRITLDLDYRPDWAPQWSFDASVLSLGKQNVDAQGSLPNRGYSTIAFGLRRTINFEDKTMLLRARVQNLFNVFAWDVRPSGGYFFNSPRALSLSVALDI